jgi:hypothetical protein
MQMVATGKIVRAGGGRAAIQTALHEFRTVGIPSEQRNQIPGATASAAMFAPFGKL